MSVSVNAYHIGKILGIICIIKIKIHSSCEIEDVSLQAVCDTPIARITGCAFKDVGRRLPLEIQIDG